MNKLLSICLIGLLVTSSYAAGTTLHGKITDKAGKAIESAYIEALKDSVSLIGYTLSDESGSFTLQLPEEKECTLRISHVSYQPFIRKITISENPVSFQLEEKNETIDEITILGYSKAMKINAEGNIVFTPAALGNTATYNLPRLLQTLPGIHVSAAGIKQNGRTTALLVNGHKRNLEGKSLEAFLKSVPVDKIKEIVIKSSSSAGDLASENGSIDIVFKQEEDMLAATIGSEASIRSGGTYGNGTVFLMYNKNNFYLDLSLNYYNIYSRKDTWRETSYPDTPVISVFDYKTHFRENDFFGMLNTQWKSKRGHKLYLSASGFYDEGNSYADNRMHFRQAETARESTAGFTRLNYDDDLYTFDATFTTNDTLRHRHSVGYGIIWGKAHNTGRTDETVAGAPDAPFEMQHNTANRHYGYQHQIRYDYKCKLDPKSTLAAGIRADLGKLYPQSELTQQAQNTDDFLYSDRFKLQDNVFAGFAEYTYKNEHTTLSAGLRLEYTDYAARFLSDSADFTYRRADFFPFFSVSRKISSALTASLRLSSGIDRPGFLDYVPNYRYTSRYAYSIGNPLLKPARLYSAAFNTMWFDFLYISMTYQYTKNIHTSITKNGETAFQEVTTFLNVCDESSFTIQGSCPYAFLGDKLSGYLGFWWGNSKDRNFKTDLADSYRRRNAFSLSNQTQYEVVENLHIGYDLYFQAKCRFRQGTTDPFVKLGIDASYKIKKISIGCSVSNVFDAKTTGTKLYDQNRSIDRISTHQPTYNIILRYTIGNTDKRKYHEGADASRFSK